MQARLSGQFGDEIVKAIMDRSAINAKKSNMRKSAKYVRYVKKNMPEIYEHYSEKHFREYGERI